MSSSYDLAKTQDSIRGMFWLPDAEGNKFGGNLSLAAGKSPRLDVEAFSDEGLANFFPNRPIAEPDETIHLTGDDFTRAMRLPSKRIIHGHDEHGAPITLIDCYASSSGSTLAMVRRRYSCRAAIFGTHMQRDDMTCSGVRLHFDPLDQWVGRCAFQQCSETYEDHKGRKRLAKIVIPFASDLTIPLGLPGYSKSEFICSWSMRNRDNDFTLSNRVFLDLYFDQPREWSEVIQELHRWQWFLSLATRTNVDVRWFALYRAGNLNPLDDQTMEPCDVWMERRHEKKAAKSQRMSRDFHFTYADVETTLPAVIAAWQRIQKPWAAVLHRFFSITERRNLWLNERFLFLAQAIESIHRARSGSNASNVDLGQAAKHAYLNAPLELQSLLGKRGVFSEQFRKTRNYWTHYGDPNPETDPDALDGHALYDFNEKLRWIVETAILQEIGIPIQCVAKVWDPRWKSHIVEYE